MDIRISDDPGDFEERRDVARLLALNEQVNDSVKSASQVMQQVGTHPMDASRLSAAVSKKLQLFIERAERLQHELETKLLPKGNT